MPLTLEQMAAKPKEQDKKQPLSLEQMANTPAIADYDAMNNFVEKSIIRQPDVNTPQPQLNQTYPELTDYNAIQQKILDDGIDQLTPDEELIYLNGMPKVGSNPEEVNQPPIAAAQPANTESIEPDNRPMPNTMLPMGGGAYAIPPEQEKTWLDDVKVLGEETLKGIKGGSYSVASGVVDNAYQMGKMSLGAVPGTAMPMIPNAKSREMIEQAYENAPSTPLAKELHDKSKQYAPAEGSGWKGFIGQAVGNAIPYMAASVTGGLVNPAAPFMVGFAVEGTESYFEALDNGASEEDARLNQVVVGSINAAIEQLQVNKVFKFAKKGKKVTKELVDAAKDKAFAKLAKAGSKLSLDTIKHATAEGLEEALQETTSVIMANRVGAEIGLKEAAERIGSSALGGAVVGGVMGVGGRIISNNGGEQQAEPIQTQKPIQETQPTETFGKGLGIGENPLTQSTAKVDESISKTNGVAQEEKSLEAKQGGSEGNVDKMQKNSQKQVDMTEKSENGDISPVVDTETKIDEGKKPATISPVKENEASRDNIAPQNKAEAGNGAKLTESQFYDKYSQHKDIRGKQSGTAKDNIVTMKSEGFRADAASFGNTIPAYQGGKPGNVVEQRYAPKKGDIVYLVPNSQINQKTGNIKKGWKPNDHEVVEVEYDNQPLYELYEKSFNQPAPEDGGQKALSKDVKEKSTSLKEEYKIQEVPIKALKLSEDVPNFKEGADIKTGVVKGEELQGSYDRLGSGPIIVWKRKNGTLEVITGRHRLDLAKRSGEKSIPAQVVKESDGFTRGMALTIDAESNIRDGQGKVKDYAHYFKNTEITEEQAKQKGLLSRAKGKNGFRIGKSSIDDVYTGFITGKLSEAKAYAIANGAPNNESAQMAALAKAGSKSADELEHYARILSRYEPSDNLKTKQGNLFGFDDSAMIEADLVSKEVQKETKSIKDRILAVKGALRRPETAKDMGLEFTDEKSIRKEVEHLEDRLDKLSRVATNPDLFDEMRQRAGLKTKKQESVQKDMLGRNELKGGVSGQQDAFADKEQFKTIEAQEETNAKDDAVGQMDIFGGVKKKAPKMIGPEKKSKGAIDKKSLFDEDKPKPSGGGSAGSSAPAVSSSASKGYGTISSSEKATKTVQHSDVKKVNSNLPAKEDFSVVSEALRLTSPAHVNNNARAGARVLRSNLGELAHKDVIAQEALHKAHHAFTFMNRDDMLDFVDRVETGKAQKNPKLQKVANTFRQLLDQRRKEIQAIGKGHLESFYENYFPHMWKEPGATKRVIARILGRKRLEGPKSFLKQRHIPTIKDGIKAGLELHSDNPVDIILLKLHEMDRYVMANSMIKDLKGRSLIKFVYARNQAPDGYSKINDNAFTVFMPPEITKKEAYDSVMVEQLMDIAQSLGIDNKRFVSIGGRRLGYAVLEPKGNEKVRTKYATPDSVLAHEIGHVLGTRYNLYDTLRRKKDGSYRTVTRGKNKGEQKFVPTKEAIDHRKVIDKEWRALADARFKGHDTTDGFKKYVRNAREKEAVMLEALMHAPDEFKRTAPSLYKLFTKFLNNHSELRPILDIKPSLVLGQSDAIIKIPGFTTLGYYYAPKDVAKLLNNYLSPGLKGNENQLISGSYNMLRGAGNILNQAQLAFSLFHGLNVTTDMMASTLGHGLRQLTTSGQRLQGIGNIALTPVSPASTVFNGIRLRRAYQKQLDTIKSPKLRAMVEAVAKAGGRDRMDTFYYNQQIKALKNTLSQIIKGSALQKATGIAKLPFNTFGATLETVAKPLMEWYVPTGKLGLFMKLASHEMKRAESGQITDEQLHERFLSSWDSVDNRMGQLVYDNLFWNKVLKDVAMLSVRSVGWNLGSWREYGGVATDLAGTKGRLNRGDKLLSQKMAYTIGAVTVYSVLGASIMYMLTGKRPEELKDYFFPKTGNKNPDGSDERLSLPTYAKDWYAYSHRPLTTLKHKTHPLWGILSDVTTNKDFFNTEIRHPGDPISKQLSDVAKHIGNEFLPLSVRNYKKMQRASSDKKNLAVSITGITSAPTYLTRSPAQKLMYHYIVENIPDKTKTRDQQDMYEYRRDIKNKIRRGEKVNEKEAIEKLGSKSFKRVKTDASKVPFAESFNRLSLYQALNVYAIASEQEKTDSKALLKSKYSRARKITDDMKTLYKELIRE